jgi:hypothetical protein
MTARRSALAVDVWASAAQSTGHVVPGPGEHGDARFAGSSADIKMGDGLDASKSFAYAVNRRPQGERRQHKIDDSIHAQFLLSDARSGPRVAH